MDTKSVSGLSVELSEIEQTRKEVGQGPAPGAVVIGGDYQGLGILRSLGRRGVPVCVVDDEHSISRYSKYCTHFVKVARLREERAIVDSLMGVADRLGLSGWVLYPTREELVAAISRHRDRLSQSFRVPTPAWSSVQWAWDKRNTYQLARELGIPTPRCLYPESLDALDELKSIDPPFAIKPAIKEHLHVVDELRHHPLHVACLQHHLVVLGLELRRHELGACALVEAEFEPGGGAQVEPDGEGAQVPDLARRTAVIEPKSIPPLR